ncbi:hypothetical protein [Halobacterium litoreum]|uniref:Uncharacterized protein n=1 Tax=Halobacterium litoreum TaxID=2039234 RepID=A0ABD5NGA3_9EURY|nr:hypothetical protein [Halobacterium litoreum]UHH12858.1 hypothetical protein LT972_11905 [Halobacterium litoreum]
MTDATRRGFVAGLLALAGCAGSQSGDGTPSTTTGTTDATPTATTQPTATSTETTENCHYESQSVEHTGVLEVVNDTGEDVTVDVTVSDADGDAAFAQSVAVAPGERTTAFRTSDGGEYVVEYATAAGDGTADWPVPDSGYTQTLTLVASEADDGQTTVDARTHTADPPATRVCE